MRIQREHSWRVSFAITAVVVLSYFLFYTAWNKESGSLDFSLLAKVLSFEDVNFSLREINKVAALAGLTLLSLAFLPGPLSKIDPLTCSQFLCLRKPLGLIGFLLVLYHSIYSAGEFYRFSWGEVVLKGKELAAGSAIVSLFIFTLMAITSNRFSVQALGYDKWKLLQRTGYIALLLAVVHFVTVETKNGVFSVRPFGYIALIVPILTLVLRVYVWNKDRKAYEEHFGKGPKHSI